MTLVILVLPLYLPMFATFAPILATFVIAVGAPLPILVALPVRVPPRIAAIRLAMRRHPDAAPRAPMSGHRVPTPPASAPNCYYAAMLRCARIPSKRERSRAPLQS